MTLLLGHSLTTSLGPAPPRADRIPSDGSGKTGRSPSLPSRIRVSFHAGFDGYRATGYPGAPNDARRRERIRKNLLDALPQPFDRGLHHLSLLAITWPSMFEALLISRLTNDPFISSCQGDRKDSPTRICMTMPKGRFSRLDRARKNRRVRPISQQLAHECSS